MSWHTVADSVLVDAALSGNNAAFSELLRRHTRPATKIAYSILRNRHDAEDEVQNACWKAYRCLADFRGNAKFSTWLTRIVVNQCLMRLRQNRRARLAYLDEPALENATKAELPDRQATPEQALGAIEVSDVVRREIGKIPPLLRNVFVLREIQQLSMDDVASTLGISVAAAKSRLLRARQELKCRLSKHCGRMGAITLLA